MTNIRDAPVDPQTSPRNIDAPGENRQIKRFPRAPVDARKRANGKHHKTLRGERSGNHQLISWSHAGRLASEAAFARLAGCAPIPASSGQIIRHRLNRGGDRQLNRALHTIVLSRLAHHSETKRYATRRTAEGKTPREIKRCLKRHLARRLFRLLETSIEAD